MTDISETLVELVFASPIAATWSSAEAETLRSLLQRMCKAMKSCEPAEFNAITFQVMQLRPALVAQVSAIAAEMATILQEAKTRQDAALLEATFVARIAAIKLDT